MRKLLALFLAVALLAVDLVQLAPVYATVNEVTAADRYTANGTTTVFAYTFKIFTKTDIEVIVDDTVKTVDTHYTVSGLGVSGGGSITFLTAPLSNAKVTILRKQPASQLSTYVLNEPFPATRIEKDFDKVIMEVQQAREQLLRGLFFKKKSTTSTALVDDLSAGKYARVNVGATGIEWVDLTLTGSYANPITTKGDVLVGGATGLASRLGVGTNCSFLQADSVEASGVKWKNCPITVADGGTGLASGTVGGVPFYTGTTTLVSRVMFPTQTTRGCVTRTHPDNDAVKNKVQIGPCDEIIFSDGMRDSVAAGTLLTCDITVAGAGGLDTGAESASTYGIWYKILAIRKSSDGTKNCLLHRAKSWENTSVGACCGTAVTRNLRILTGTPTDKIAQSFTPNFTGVYERFTIDITRTGSVVGNVWFTLEADSAGNPSGTPLATSEKLDASRIPTNPGTGVPQFAIFRTAPTTLTSGTTYWIVLQGDYTKSDTVFIGFNGFATTQYTGVAKEYNGAAWATIAGLADMALIVYAVKNNTADDSSLPAGYDQYAHVGWVLNDAAQDFKPFHASDRTMWTLGDAWMIGTIGATFNLTDLFGYVPPTPTFATFRVNSLTSAHNVDLGHYGAVDMTGTNNGKRGVSSLLLPAIGSSGLYQGHVGPVFIEYHGLTTRVGVHTSEVQMDHFSW